jgi:4-hydroxy-tetrahydrodipicolinate synthase
MPKTAASRLHGIIAPATTPFDGDGTIDLPAMHQQVDWLIANGVHGIAVGGSTGEGHTLERAEADALVACAVDASQDRVPIVAGIITNSTRESVARGRDAAARGVAALQVTPVHYLFRPDDDAMVDHFRTLAEETGTPVIIYNVVPWTYLSPALLLRIMREVPGVIGVKQSAGDLKLLADLLLDAQPGNRIFSAVDALMYSSFALGAHGAIAAILTAAPATCVALWDAVQAGDHVQALDLHRRLLVLWNAMPHENLPACVKAAQRHQDCPVGPPRAPMPPATEAQRRAIRAAIDGLAQRQQAAE